MKRMIVCVFLTFSGIFGSFISPFYGLCVYIWFAYMRAQEWMWDSGWFVALRPSLTLAVCVILGSLIRGEKIFNGNKISLTMLVFWFFLFISFIFSPYKATANVWFGNISKILILGFVIGAHINSRKRLITVIMVIISTLGYYGGKCGLFGIMHPSGQILEGPGGMLGDNNDFALAFNMLLPFIYFGGELIKSKKYKKYKMFLKVLFWLTALGVIFTYSRGGFLGLALVMLMVNYRSKKKIISLVISALLIAVIVACFMPEAYKTRISTINASEEERDDSVKGRLHFWKVAVAIANANPIGIGQFCFSEAYNRYDSSGGYFGNNRACHSSFFQMLADNGYISTGLFLFLIMMSIMICRKIRRQTKKIPGFEWAVSCANMFEISLMAYCVSGFFLSQAYHDLLYHIFFITGSLEQVVNSELRALRNKKQTDEKININANPLPVLR